MNKPVILSLGAMACALMVFAVPSYNNAHRDKLAQGNPGVATRLPENNGNARRDRP